MEEPMSHFAGLDVSLDQTSVCIVDSAGTIIRELKVASEPEALVAALKPHAGELERVGLEAGPLSAHLFSGLTEAGFPVICVEVKHMAGVVRAQFANKTDRNDARGLALMMRAGLFKPVHVKTELSQRLNVLLRTRKILLSKVLDIESDLRGVLKNFGLKVGKVTPKAFEARIRELASFDPFILQIVEPVLSARRVLREQFDCLHVMLLSVAKNDPICRRLMTMPGVGAIVAVTFRVVIDVPSRFAKSKTVGAHIGLTPRRHQSGELNWQGRISKAGDPMLRAALYEAANALLIRVAKPVPLKLWAMRLAKRRGRKKAVVALCRKMAVILHRMWMDGTDFHWEGQTA
jgi:transposase